jgi:lysozyme
MNRAAAFAIVLGGGLAALAFSARSQTRTPEFSYSDFASIQYPDGSLNLSPSFKPAQDSGDADGFLFGAPSSPFKRSFSGLDGVGEWNDFDWGAWGDTVEWWGAQQIAPEFLPTENEMPSIDQIDTSQLIHLVADHLEGEEGYVPFVYDDANGKPWSESKRGNPTIGFGHMLTAADIANYGYGWTLSGYEEARALLLSDVNRHLAPIIPAVKVPLTIPQWVAVTSLAFNAGPSAVKKSSFLRAVNAGNMASAEANFKDWNKSTVKVDGVPVKRVNRGLVNRREREWALFSQPAQVVMLVDGGYVA